VGMPRAPAVLVAALVAASALPAAAQPRCEAPRTLLVVDESSSMVEPLPTGTTKWEAARTAIRDLTSSFESGIDFGLELFPTGPGCALGPVSIPVGSGTSASILGALGDPPPYEGWGTPIAEALDVAGSHPPLLDPTRSRHVILITDGTQWCGAYDPAYRFDPVFAVGDLRRAGIRVHVVGFGAAADALVLNRAAVAAGTELPGCDATLEDPAASGHCYHQADDLSELRDALDAVARSVSEEVCDGFDNDCDGLTDEGFDVDEDGYTICGTVPGEAGSTDPDREDCDDADDAIHPGATEICNGVDDDCDGSVDPGCACLDGETRPCGSDVGACATGMQRCIDGAWDESCEGDTPPSDELCNGIDDDCDTAVDDGAECAPEELCMEGECVPVPVDAGPPPAADAGGPAPDAGVAPPPRAAPSHAGGCACDTSGGAPHAAPLAATLLLLLSVATRRRR